MFSNGGRDLGGIVGSTTCMEKKGEKLILELDSLLVVQLIKNGPKSINVASRIIREIRRMLSFAWEVHIQYVMREGNRATDALANIGVRCG